MAKSSSTPIENFIQQSIDAEAISKLFGQTIEYTLSMLAKHGVTSLPRCRTADDGLDAFYSDMTSFNNIEPSLTKQEFTDTCDPNFIVERHQRGLDISMQLTAKPLYGDFTDVPTSYHQALSIVTQARQSFMQLDAKVRARFDNDPALFVDFVSNPENAQALIDMGLAVAKPQESSTQAAGEAPANASAGGGGEGV